MKTCDSYVITCFVSYSNIKLLSSVCNFFIYFLSLLLSILILIVNDLRMTTVHDKIHETRLSVVKYSIHDIIKDKLSTH